MGAITISYQFLFRKKITKLNYAKQPISTLIAGNVVCILKHLLANAIFNAIALSAPALHNKHVRIIIIMLRVRKIRICKVTVI